MIQFLRPLFCCLALLSPFLLTAQSDYYNDLIIELTTDYNLPGPGNPIGFNEQTILDGMFNYGTGKSVSDVTGQPFTKKAEFTTASIDANVWSRGMGIAINSPINAGDAVVMVAWLRGQDAEAVTAFYFEEAGDDYSKEVGGAFPVSTEWKRYIFPFVAQNSYAPGGGQAVFHVGYQTQTLEVAGLAMFNFGQGISLDQLPDQRNNDTYDGIEADAPWRAEADARIAELRMADLKVSVVDGDGNVVPNAAVEVEMTQHAFGFGTAVATNMLDNNGNFNATYQSKILDLDGEGHGFNEIVTENSLKWRAWEQGWAGSKAETANALEWASDNGLYVRGHNLLWPGSDYLPNDILNNLNDATYVRDRITARTQQVLNYPGIEESVDEWDVLNEITTNRTIEEAFAGKLGYTTGREYYVDYIAEVRAQIPDKPLYINDFMTVSQGGLAPSLDNEWMTLMIEIENAAPGSIDGIGFQSHIIGFPVAPTRLLDIFDRYANAFPNAAQKVTEFDLLSVPPSVETQYTEDFLTATFSHPNMEAFLMWGFWDGKHWRDSAPMFDLDWNLKPAGQGFLNKVFGDWWTETTLTTDAQGEATERVFKGDYNISIDCNGETITYEVDVRDDRTYEVSCNGIVGTRNAIPVSALAFSPNPAHSQVRIDYPAGLATGEILLHDTTGRLAGRWTDLPDTISVDHLPAGSYVLSLRTDTRLYRERLEIVR